MEVSLHTYAFGLAATACAGAVTLATVLKPAGDKQHPRSPEFNAFAWNWLTVFVLAMGGDWCQGPYLYALYQSKGLESSMIATLFVAGFLSSLLLGTFVASFADVVGRRKMALLFCGIYSVASLLVYSDDLALLFLGRVLSGIATSLLFSVFEAWMISENQRRGFRPELLSYIFSQMSFWAFGVAAILAGLVSSTVVARTGQTASPYAVAVALFTLAAVIIQASWEENSGASKARAEDGGADQGAGAEQGQAAAGGLWQVVRSGVGVMVADWRVLAAAAVQVLFEGSMYTFVFLWTPALRESLPVELADGDAWQGIVFSTFMACVMVGSQAIPIGAAVGVAATTIYGAALLAGAAALAVPIFWEDHTVTLAAFCVFELVCGIHFPASGMLRARFVPEATRSTVTSLSRVGVNAVVIGLLLGLDGVPQQVAFAACVGMLLLASGFAWMLRE